MRSQWFCGGFVAAALVTQHALAVEMPPVDLAGGLSYNLQSARAPGEDVRSWSHTVTQNITAASYIYAPWLVGVSSNVNLTRAVNWAGSSGTANSESSTVTVTGGLVLNVLPRSRYPVEIAYDRFDSAASFGDELESVSGDTLRLASRVFWSDTLNISTNATISDIRADDGAGEDFREIDIAINKNFKVDEINLRFNHRDTNFENADGGTETGKADAVSWRYRSQPFTDVTTDSVSTFRMSSLTSENSDEENTVMQGVTTAMWRPKDWRELTVHGALRTYRQSGSIENSDSGASQENTFQTAFGTLAATYLFSPNLIADAGVDAGYDDQEFVIDGVPAIDEGTLSMGGRTGLNYTAPRDRLLGFDWTWSTGGSMSARHAGDGLLHSETVRLGHSASRMIALPYLDDEFSLSLSQGLSVGYTSEGEAFSVNHSASISRSTREGKHWDYLGVSVSDNRGFGSAASESQLLNLQFSRGYDADRFTAFSGNVTWQLARFSGIEGIPSTQDSLSGNLSYRKINLFGMPRLSFNSTLSFDPPSFFKSDRTEFSTIRRRAQQQNYGTQRWTNRLDYMIGKLRTSVIGRVNNTPSGIGETLLFQVSRRF